MIVSEIKNKLDSPKSLKSDLPPIRFEEGSEIAKLAGLSMKNSEIPWPRLQGHLPIQNPKSISPRNDTERTGTETNLPFTKRTNNTHKK